MDLQINKYVKSIPDDFVSCIKVYNNLFLKDDLITWECDRNVTNLFYIKALIIQKILSLSGEYLDTNYTRCSLDVNDFLPNKTYINEYLNRIGLLIVSNRKGVLHQKASKLFTMDLLCDVKDKLSSHGLIVNIVICWVYDMSVYTVD